MSEDTVARTQLSRRTLLRRGAVLSTVLELGLATTTGQAAAMKEAALIEAMAREAGLSKADAKRALDAFTNTTTEALASGDSVALASFGSFSVSKPATRGRGAGPTDRSPVDFEACPEFAAALGLSPGNGDERRAEASSRCSKADVVIDAERIARETGREGGLSKADAKKALDAFINATTKALKKGGRLSLVGFGSFSISKRSARTGPISERSARTGRNPQTGKEIQIAAKNVVKFKAGAELSKAVN